LDNSFGNTQKKEEKDLFLKKIKKDYSSKDYLQVYF